ncbi:DMT family transporter [Paenibacillus sambharensis]|uniref:DMT family transporter n=1 Tax=Paenibacillus sambharensis TaxID=1803190 RepID=UPI001FE4C99A|nr:DMT family transporter [Paenibacillus sambharensis]
MGRNAWYYVGLLAVAAIWGANFGFSRWALASFDPILFTFLRFGLAVPLFFGLLWWKEGSIGVSVKAGLQLAVIGAVGVAALEIAVTYSIKYTTLANASLLNVAPWPIFAALFAPLFLKERFTSRLAAGGAAALAGVCLIILGGEGGFDPSSDHMLGNGLALMVSVIGALYNLACMPLMRTYSALRVSAWSIAFGSLFMAPFTAGSWAKVDWSGLGSVHYAVLAYNILLATVAAFIIWNACMFRVGAARANFFRYAVPLSAVIAGLVMFGETVTMWQLFGGVFMAAGLVWISTERRQPLETPAG